MGATTALGADSVSLTPEEALALCAGLGLAAADGATGEGAGRTGCGPASGMVWFITLSSSAAVVRKEGWFTCACSAFSNRTIFSDLRPETLNPSCFSALSSTGMVPTRRYCSMMYVASACGGIAIFHTARYRPSNPAAPRKACTKLRAHALSIWIRHSKSRHTAVITASAAKSRAKHRVVVNCTIYDVTIKLKHLLKKVWLTTSAKDSQDDVNTAISDVTTTPRARVRMHHNCPWRSIGAPTARYAAMSRPVYVYYIKRSFQRLLAWRSRKRACSRGGGRLYCGLGP